MQNEKYDIIIAGGGLAGLVSAIELSRSGFRVALFEKKIYPFHKVCGEYISNEIRDYLFHIGLKFEDLNPPEITELKVTGLSGKIILNAELRTAGFGLSRYELDYRLCLLAKEANVDVFENTRVKNIEYVAGNFYVKTDAGEFISRVLIGSYGKRDFLDKQLNRGFFFKRTGYLAVKYHIKTDLPANQIGLYNFNGGYCGVSKIEGEKYCLCYLVSRDKIAKWKTIPQLEEKVLFQNEGLKNIFQNSDFLFEKPEVINEISFDLKRAVENHVLMCGDSAGLITPLCGNGMAMAVHGAKLLSSIISGNITSSRHIRPRIRENIELLYQREWDKQFRRRMIFGRNLQSFSGRPYLTGGFLRIANQLPYFKNWVIRQTHGEMV